MTDVNNTLVQRGNRYGSFENNARVVQELLDVAMTGETAANLPPQHKEALHMIFHKIARMVNGDCWYDDTPHDIAGYATLLEEFIKEHSLEKQMEARSILPDEEITGRNRYLK